MRHQFVWIVGYSAVGKQTLIDALQHGTPGVKQSPAQLSQLFGVDISHGISQAFYGDPSCDVVDDEPLSFDGILQASDKVACVLIKWQTHYGDACVKLSQLRPDARHVVTHLHREQQDHLRAFQDKYGERFEDERAAERQFFRAFPKNKLHCERFRLRVDTYHDVAVFKGRYYLI